VTAHDVTFLTTYEARPGPSACGFVTGDRYGVSEHHAEEARLDLEDIHRRFGVTRSDRSQEPNEGRAILQLREAAEAKKKTDLSISDDRLADALLEGSRCGTDLVVAVEKTRRLTQMGVQRKRESWILVETRELFHLDDGALGANDVSACK